MMDGESTTEKQGQLINLLSFGLGPVVATYASSQTQNIISWGRLQLKWTIGNVPVVAVVVTM